ncbi:MAG: hypothetical protein A2142_06150 [candidate division Zixibacteria bacterium RBG_16_48_11]|nr:MAG: hypothetical protein A2142_06150 [candidate division Zixibacteria bacterium RBG_16_48_11]
MFRRPGKFIFVIVVLCLLVLAATAWSRTKKEAETKRLPGRAETAAVEHEIRVHNVGKFWLSVSNYGIFGSESGRLRDPCTRKSAPSGEFPGGTGVSYLFQGALWVGAVVGEGAEAETLVTVGADGWSAVNEMIAVEPFVTRTIRSSGIRQGDCTIPYDSIFAVSEQDFIAVYADTCSDPSLCESDDLDGPFKPLNIKITQKSYAWSYDYSQDFVLFDYILENIGANKLNGVYLALYIDADNHNYDVDAGGFEDDVSGFKSTVPSFRCPTEFEDTLNVAWTGDNEGLSDCICPDNIQKVFLPQYSPTSLAGTRVVKAPGQVKTSFNWWNSNGNDANLDWGPWTLESIARRPSGFGAGTLGTPEGNPSKYFAMSNGEFDYDQLMAALPIWADSGWILPPEALKTNIADGYDTRYLLSFGPFSVKPGEPLFLTLAYLAGEDFHVLPSDWQIVNGNFTDVNAVLEYLNRKDFSDFATNARWAGWVYDNPGVDTPDTLTGATDGNKGKYRICEGDTVYYEGDGIPDFAGPPPPVPPDLQFKTKEGEVVVRWNGHQTETGLDYFSNEADFEGYRVFLSYTGFPDDYALLDSYDKRDFKMYVYNPGTNKWQLKLASLDSATLVNLFAEDDPCCDFDGKNCICIPNCGLPGAFGPDPKVWTLTNPYEVHGYCRDIEVTSSVSLRTGEKVYFDRQDWNKGLDAIKVYRDSIALGLITPADTAKYYLYEYPIRGLSASKPVYIAVSAFDYGNPQTGLSPLETSPLVNAKQVWPLASPLDITDQKVVVFPNPYKITEEYPGEDRNLPSGKLLHFVQLPGPCKIRIYTLDGDEVAVIDNTGPNSPNNSEVNWNMISSNGQEVVAGIYIYHVESARGSQIGKFVLIK